ncbi:hypothetical protein HN51_069367 [Arachis hypogaea]
MLNDEEKTTSGVLRHWYMPTVFSQMALSGTIPSSQVREDYKEAFMGKIYVPVNEDNLHWYLVIFDMNQCQVILLDSNPDPKKKASKIFSIKQLALYLEGMLQHDSFYDFTIRPKVSEFPILEALGIGRQRNDSFDCGIWVATWMKNCIWIDDYNIYVDDATRMRIAIDLIMKYVYAFNELVIPSIQKFGPDMIVLTIGLDSSAFDPNGRQCLTIEGYRKIGKIVHDLAKQHSDGRLVIVQEGGYHVTYSAYYLHAFLESVLSLASLPPFPDPIVYYPEDEP